MRVKEIIKKLEELDQEGIVVLYYNGEFHSIKIEEYNCNCSNSFKTYYLGENDKNETKKEFFV